MRRRSNVERRTPPEAKLGWTVRLAVSCAVVAAACWGAVTRAQAATELKYAFPPGGQRGTSVELTATGAFDPRPTRVWVERDGVAWGPVALATADAAEGDKSSELKRTATIADDAAPAVYWFRLVGEEGATSPCPFVVGHLPEIVEAENNNHWRTPQSLPTAESMIVNGVLSPRNDVDVFAVTLAAGQAVVAQIASHQLLDSPVDGVLEIVSATGAVLAQNDDHFGLDPRIAYVAPADGVYLVRVFGFPASPNSTIGFDGGGDHLYRLLVSTGPYADSTWPLAVAAGTTTPIEVYGWNLADGDRRLDVTASAAGELPAELVGRYDDSQPLSVVPHGTAVEAAGDAPESFQAITLPTTVTGRIEPDRDTDEFRFTAAANTVVEFRVESRGLGFALDPVLELFDGEGKSLVRVDDSEGGRDAVLTHTTPAEGEYRLVVSDLYRQGGPRYMYRLHATVAVPDFEFSVDQHAVVATPEKPAELKLTITRQHGFASEITFSVEDLPEGVTAAAPNSPAEGDASKAVTLTLSTTATGYSGPIRILGRAERGDAEISHVAQAPIPGHTATTPTVWLTTRAATGE